MAVDRHVAKFMALGMGVGMAVKVGTGHKAMLYYNITSVYFSESPLLPGLTAARSASQSLLPRTEMAATRRRGTIQSARA